MKKVFLLFVLLSFLFACNQRFDLGLDILPPEDFADLQVVDTITVVGKTVLSEGVRTNNVNTLLLGRYNDPYFGITSAGFVCQMFLVDYPGFPDDIVLDSVCMVMPLKFDDNDYYYGNPFAPVKVKVYRITDTLDKYQAHYSDEQPDVENYTLIGDNVIRFNLPDSSISIRLFDSWGQYLIDNEEDIFYGYGTFFHQIIRGFYFQPYEGDGAIFRIDPTQDRYHTRFKMLIYYHRQSKPDSQIVFDGVQLNNISVRYNLFQHDYTNTPIEQQLQNPDNYFNTRVYLQGLAGTKIELKFPFIENLAKENIIVNKAILQLKIAPNSIGRFNPVEEIAFMAKDEQGNEVFFEDFIEPTSNSYQGATLQNYFYYNFNFTRIAQTLIKGGYSNLTFYIVDKNASTDFKRSVITTSLDPDEPLKLVIFYTKLNQ